MTLDALSLPGAAASRLLSAEPWAREHLAPHGGRTFWVTVGPVVARFRVATDGALESVPATDAAPDLGLTISPLDLPTLLADPSRFRVLVREDGDPALARSLESIACTLPWFVEQLFSRALGPLLGERVAAAGRSLLTFPREAMTRVAEGVVRYAHDEAQLLANGTDLRSFAAETRALAERVDALDRRVEALDRGEPKSAGVKAVRPKTPPNA